MKVENDREFIGKEMILYKGNEIREEIMRIKQNNTYSY